MPAGIAYAELQVSHKKVGKSYRKEWKLGTPMLTSHYRLLRNEEFFAPYMRMIETQDSDTLTCKFDPAMLLSLIHIWTLPTSVTV